MPFFDAAALIAAMPPCFSLPPLRASLFMLPVILRCLLYATMMRRLCRHCAPLSPRHFRLYAA